MELYVKGDVKAIFFSNPSNFYKVMLVGIEETNLDYDDDEIVVVGNVGRIQEGQSYEFYGTLVDHPKYGIQLKVDRYKVQQPSSKEAIIQYLSSSRFKGIGQVTAERIVDTLGLECLDRILADKEVLKQVPRLNQAKRDTIAEVITAERGLQQVILKLNEYGITNQLAYKIYAMYRDETLEQLQTNPYQLAVDIEGIGFNKADHIASELEISEEAPSRIQAAIYFVLYNQCLSGGHTYLEAEQLLTETLDTLESSRPYIIEPHLVEENLAALVESQAIIADEARFYVPSLFAAEWGIVQSIEHLLSRQPVQNNFSERVISQHIEKVQASLGIQYGESQRQAIHIALNESVFILTGGPGTGKTTVLDGIVTIFSQLHDLSLDPNDYTDDHFPILMAAPTGRAAKQMAEATGLPASTIHRLLGLGVDREERESSYEAAELKGQLLIIDEMSMVDTWLANQLFKSIPAGMQVILVGDKDQLPSVGPGQVLRDLIDSGQVPQVELIDIYRQGDESSIIPLAHSIKQGRLPVDFTDPKNDRSFLACGPHNARQLIEKVVKRALAKGYSVEDIQVLAPMYRGDAGIDKLNQSLQAVFNPKTPEQKEVSFIDKVYRVGDKVLHLVNEAELGIFNGDIGYIVGIIPKQESELNTDELVIDFDGNEVSYPRSEWTKITLAYCCSIHKAQGSEYKMVILPLVGAFHRMLRKDLLYTAVTRASQFLILCGQRKAYEQCVATDNLQRQTTLKPFLLTDTEQVATIQSTIEQSEDQPLTEHSPEDTTEQWRLTPQLIQSGRIDPMIGMEGLTPSNA
ncbi:SF1B family DNA helicase RecD2 [Dolosigranulum pigrum]|uniref:SF1B family DNA helicase RecD2 n=1 Tax=Dolosigranulum pigrum TaxID=29394 RepID=UPI000DC55632|nr:ATP-dependent RecD-like DNA helicase [Dolosigranulum pigrum]RAN54188.1 exodeoxyribonuclease V subunit alpha [Dolosigranulum pigrum]